MPAKYHEGAKKAYESGRTPIYSDEFSAEEQKKWEIMMREQIRKETGYTPKEKKEWPKAWTPAPIAMNTKAKKIRKGLLKG